MNMKKNFYIASDHAGFALKTQILKKSAKDYIDLGTNNSVSVDYPEYAAKLVEKIKFDKNSLGILICGSGIGMAIAANRDEFIRAGLAFNPEIAKQMRKHNDANILVLPGRFIDVQEALKCVDNFIETDFEGGRHQRRIDKLNKKNE
jgi:ribose 5-phosphate isomerase B